MDLQTLKEKIESLDPIAHRALRETLIVKHGRLHGGIRRSRAVG